MSNEPPLLEVRDLRKTFGGIVAVDDVSFDVERGTVTGLIGPNGAGKTTTFNLVSGFYLPDSGEIRYDGRSVSAIMDPGDRERNAALSASGLFFGVVGLGIAAGAGLPAAGLGGAAVVGAGVGGGLYTGFERLRNHSPEYRRPAPFRVANAGLVRTFQIARGLSDMTVLENLMLAAKRQRGENVFNAAFRHEAVTEQEGEIRERAHETLELLELSHLAEEYASNLSGGQRKLLELGRVLMMDPELIALDEPVAGVNPTLTTKLLGHIDDLRSEGYTFLIIEHDMDVIMRMSDTIVVMAEGRKLMEGSADEVRTDERVIDAYLGGG